MAPPTSRRPIVGVSTKTYFSLARTREYVDALVRHFSTDDNKALLDRIDVFVVPDFIALPSVIDRLRDSGLPLLPGAQDCSWEDYGAFTGTVSPAVLADVGTRLVEIGHAERRRLFGETDATTAAKAVAIARNGMIPLVCIGEVEDPGTTEAHVAVTAAIATVVNQITPVLAAIPLDTPVLLAYEPVWAIGASQPASAAYVCNVVTGLRASSAIQRRGDGRTRILYGGSAGPGLFAQLEGVVDGLFLGRFGHDPDAFMQTAREVAGHTI